jgi:GWxTD domain-containing protein
MRRWRTCLIVLAAAALAAAGNAPGQDSADPGYVEFCLAQLTPEMRHEVEALRCVLTKAEFDELLSLVSDEDRRCWIDDYWSSMDPILTTPENEIRVEHARRVAYAESEFFIPRSPMWDERGEVYIRYGPPTFRQILRAETDQYRITPPGELWHYAWHDMMVLFEDPFSSGEYTCYVERVHGPPSSRLRGTGDAIDAPIAHTPPYTAEVLPPSIVIESAYNEYLKKIGNFHDLLRRKPAIYSYELPSAQQPFVFSVEHFRGGEWIDRVDVNVEFQADLAWSPVVENRREYVTTAVFWDTRRKEVGRRQRTADLTVGEGFARSTRLIPAQLVFSLPPGFYHMAVTVEDRTSGRVSSHRADVTCRDFESRLALSDVLFAAMIRPSERVSPYNRGPLEVVPHPLRRYQRFESIPVYFEIYNLGTDDRGVSAYTVEYQVVNFGRSGEAGEPPAGKKPRPEIASSFRMSADGPFDVVHFEIKSDNLREGTFDFRVTVKDEKSRAVAHGEGSFTVVE